MPLSRVIYSSRPFGFDTGVLNGILADARRANRRDDITGALICRADLYLQWLEGPEDRLRATMARIRRDDRHVEVIQHVATHPDDRVFARWEMLHDPAATWIWTQAEVRTGARERATPEEVTGFFLTLRAKVRPADRA